MHLALVKYSVLRLALFVGSLVVLWAVGVKRSIMMVVLAALISLALSYLLLGKQREAVAQGIAARIESRIEHRQNVGQADADAEDAAVDHQTAVDHHQAASDQAASDQTASTQQTASTHQAASTQQTASTQAGPNQAASNQAAASDRQG